MKRTVCLVLTLLVCLVGPVLAQERTSAAAEKIVRETYRKLEIYNAAAQVSRTNARISHFAQTRA